LPGSERKAGFARISCSDKGRVRMIEVAIGRADVERRVLAKET
jgi:hypothetical protein